MHWVYIHVHVYSNVFGMGVCGVWMGGCGSLAEGGRDVTEMMEQGLVCSVCHSLG